MKVYVVRHCKATGQEAEAALTMAGADQAKALVPFFSQLGIEQIISSPYERAIATVRPFVEASKTPFSLDPSLEERRLGECQDWMEDLRRSFDQEHLTFTGGESTYEATLRVRALYDRLPRSKTHLLVTHGNLMMLLLRSFDKEQFGYEAWNRLSNPDLYLIEDKGGRRDISRISLV